MAGTPVARRRLRMSIRKELSEVAFTGHRWTGVRKLSAEGETGINWRAWRPGLNRGATGDRRDILPCRGFPGGGAGYLSNEEKQTLKACHLRGRLG